MISVIIPMYNAKNTILLTLESVVSQTYTDVLEIIIVNDGSTDGSELVVDDYIKKTSLPNRSFRLISKENGGVSSARNKGILSANGEWVAFIDSDDYWDSCKLEKQMKALEENPDISFIGTDFDGQAYPFFKKSEHKVYSLNAKEIILKWYPHTSSVLAKRSIFLKDNLFFNEKRSHAEDGELLLRIVQNHKIYVLHEDLVKTGYGKRSFGESGLSANLPKMFRGEIYIIKSAKGRKQISTPFFIFSYVWLYFKYIRRQLIVGLNS